MLWDYLERAAYFMVNTDEPSADRTIPARSTWALSSLIC